MEWKRKTSAFYEALVSGELLRSRSQAAQVLNWLLNFLLGMVMSAAPLLNECGPFGVAAAAQAGPEIGGLMCSLGAAVGYLTVYGFETGIRYTAAVALAYTAAFAFRDRKLQRSAWFMPVLAGCFTLLAGVMGGVAVVRGRSWILPTAVQALFACGSCWFFREALSAGERDTEKAELRHMVALAFFLACLLMALVPAKLGSNLSLGRVAALCAAMIAAGKGGTLSGCAVGTALGFAMDLAGRQTPFYAMSYAICGLVAGVFSRQGRFISMLSFVLTGAAVTICASGIGFRQEMLFELLAAALVYVLLPNRVLSLIGNAVRPIRGDEGESGLRRYTARRMERMGEAFEDLYATVDAVLARETNDEDLSKVFDRASETVCGKCRQKNSCWNSRYLDTLNAFNDAVPRLRERGMLLRTDLPSHFLERCDQADALVGAINGELRGQMYRRQFRSRLRENRTAAYAQYLDMANVLTDVSEELRNAYGPDVLSRRKLLRYLDSLGIDADVSVFRDRSGRLHILLESVKLQVLLKEPGYLDRISGVVGLRLCRPGGETEGEGRITLMEAEPLCATVGIASMRKKGERVSGDRGTYFKTDQGVLCIILSDGMGSGEDAARESVAAVRILERFLRCGLDPASAMKILNHMMLLKNDEQWGFATVDLLCIDLFTGEAVFYKYGAAPSYVCSGRSVKRIRSETLAAGLQGEPEAMPDVVRLRLKPGAVALIASDGVIAETNDAWLRELLGEQKGEDMKALARETLEAAHKLYGAGDDMTVLTVRLAERA